MTLISMILCIGNFVVFFVFVSCSVILLLCSIYIVFNDTVLCQPYRSSGK